MNFSKETTADDLVGAADLVPTPSRAPHLQRIANQLLNGERKAGRKPADQDWLTSGQLARRRRREVPLGDNDKFLSPSLKFRAARKAR